MTGFVYQAFRGAVPGVAPRLLDRSQAQSATDFDVRDGDLVPLRRLKHDQVLAKTGTMETVWRWDDQAWFHWPFDVDVVDGAVPDDTEARTYFTGDGQPQMTYAGIATSSGNGVYPSNSYDLGVPAPASAPSVTVTGSANDENDIGEDRTYVYTYVSAKGEEGPPSDPSASVLWKPGQAVDLSSMDTGPGGNRNISTKRIYRTATAGDSTAFQYVDEISLASTTYSDTVDTDALGEVIPSITWDPPPSDLIGLTAMPNGILAAFRNNEICFCESYLPHAWPTGYRLQTEPDIVALGAFGNSLVVGTKDYPYLVTGTDPSAMAMQRIEIPYRCAAKRAMVEMGFGVIYPSQDGLVRVTSDGPRLITDGLFTPRQWRTYNPTSMHAYRWDDYYLLFYQGDSENGGMIIPPGGEWVVFLSRHASAGYLDPKFGTLYVVRNGDNLQAFDSDNQNLTATWRSRTEVSPRPINLGAARIEADSYPQTFRLYADGTLKATISVSDDRPFMLPGGYLAERYEIEVEFDDRVRRIEVAESARELAQL